MNLIHVKKVTANSTFSPQNAEGTPGPLIFGKCNYANKLCETSLPQSSPGGGDFGFRPALASGCL